MEKENIIKALECCIEGECGDCSYDEQTACKEYLLHDALALIKELTEDNERLTKQIEMSEAAYQELQFAFSICANQAKADTVREFAERLKKECLVDSGYEVLQIGTIDRIAEEMLGKECTDCKHFVGCECFDGKVCDLYEKK